jgi:hypothetical protein
MNWMNLFVRSRSFIALVAAATTLAATLPPPAAALLAPTEVVTTQDSGQRQTDLRKVQTLLESKVVRQRLVAMGLNESEIDARLTQLSDTQLHQVASRIDTLHPAGDAGLGIVVTLLVIGILVLLFLYLAKRI